MCHNKHSHFALTDIVHSGYCGLAISICVWQHTVAKTEVLKQASWLPCRNTRQSFQPYQLQCSMYFLFIRIGNRNSKGILKAYWSRPFVMTHDGVVKLFQSNHKRICRQRSISMMGL